MKIVVLDGNMVNPGDLSWKGIEALGDLTVYDRTEPDQIVSRIGDAEAILLNKTPITAKTLDRLPGLKYIGVLATGYNVVDVDAAADRGIIVTNIPGYATQAVAQYVFALLLEVCHHVGHHNQAVQEGRWARSRDFCFWDYPMMELNGKTMGIIGYGRTGKEVARIAKAFGMNVIATGSSKPNPSLASLDEVLQNSDVISLHCPLLKETANLINKDTIARMKDGVILINTARGGIVNENDLREALISHKVKAAAVDVVSVEPIRDNNPLLGLDNCIITPHIAWAPRETRGRLMGIVTDNLKTFLQGAPINVVTPVR